MNLTFEIKQLQKDLELVQDENLINSIKSILAFAKEQRNNVVFQPFSFQEYVSRAVQSEQDIKFGRFINVDDL